MSYHTALNKTLTRCFQRIQEYGPIVVATSSSNCGSDNGFEYSAKTRMSKSFWKQHHEKTMIENMHTRIYYHNSEEDSFWTSPALDAVKSFIQLAKNKLID